MFTSFRMSTRSRSLAALTSVFLAGGLALSACSGGDLTSSADSSVSSIPADATFNAADIAFAQDMVPHHEQAVEMAQMVPARSTDPDVIALASRIEAAQEPEIATLTGWLDDWGVDTSDDAMAGMDHSGSGMSGMMSDEDMSALDAATGVEFDRMWLEMMLEHHTGAVGMAETEISHGKDASAIALAQDIKSSQSAEITEMEQLLQSLATQ